eukprot:1161509-Pelagomonas_calceolata.AAC.4
MASWPLKGMQQRTNKACNYVIVYRGWEKRPKLLSFKSRSSKKYDDAKHGTLEASSLPSAAVQLCNMCATPCLTCAVAQQEALEKQSLPVRKAGFTV